MSVAGPDVTAPEVCVNHPRRETALHCGKCGVPICTRCTVQTPVGVRCRSCARLKRLPQFDVSPLLLLRSALVGLPVSIVAWFVASYVGYLQFVLAVLVGVAVGEVMSRLARRRTSRALEVLTVVVVVAGLGVAQVVRALAELPLLVTALGQSPSFFIALLFPAVIASFVAVVKLR